MLYEDFYYFISYYLEKIKNISLSLIKETNFLLKDFSFNEIFKQFIESNIIYYKDYKNINILRRTEI